MWVGDERRELARHEIAEALGARDEAVVADDLERREARSAGHRVATERRPMGAGEPALLKLAGRDDGAQRQTTAEGLREHEDVRRHADLLGREPRTGSPEARLHLIEDEERADTRRQLAQCTQERDGRRDVSAFTEHRLDEDRRDVLRRQLVFEKDVELREAVLRTGLRVVRLLERTREGVRERRHVHIRQERAVAAPIRGLRRRHRGRARRTPVESAAEHDDRVAARDLPCELQRSFDGLSAAVAEEHRVETARRHLDELLGQRDVRFVERHPGADVRKLRGLRRDR